MLLAISGIVASAEALPINIKSSDFGKTETVYVTTEFEFSVGANKFKTNNVNPSSFQIRGNQSAVAKNFYLYNTSDFGTIKEITLTAKAATMKPGNYSLYLADAAFTGAPSGTATLKGSGNTAVNSFTLSVPADSKAKYFYLQLAKGATSGTCELTSITITYEAADTSDTREDAGLKYETTSYTIPFGDEFPTPELTNPNNLDVTYNSSNEVVATVAADGAVTIKGVGTTTIKAEFAGNDTYKDDIATYTLTVLEAATTLAEFIEKGAADKSLSLIMNCELTVAYAHGKNVYVTDGTSSALIYKDNLGLNTGDVIAKGWDGKVTIYNGLPEIAPADATLATTGTTAEVNYAAVEAIGIENLTQVVLLKNVTFAAATLESTHDNFNGIAGENTYAFRNTFGVASVAAGKYDVLCVVSAFKQGATTIVTDPANLRLLPIEYTEVVVPSFVDGKISIVGMGVSLDGLISASYSFSIANYTGGEPVLTVQVLDADGNVLPEDRVAIDIKPGETPAGAPVKAAATTKAFEGTIEALVENPGAEGTNYQLAMTAEYNGVKIESTSEKTPTAVEGIVVDNNAAAEYYNLQGVRVANPAAGVYIRISGGKATRVYVR